MASSPKSAVAILARRNVLVLCAAALGLTLWLLRGEGPRRAPLERAREAARRGDWRKVEDAAGAARRADPDDEDALILLARALARNGNALESWGLYRQAQPASLEADDLFAAGLSLIERENRVLGWALLRAARHAAPGHAESLGVLARVEERGGEDHPDAAAVAHQMEALIGATPRALVLLGLIEPSHPTGGDPAAQAEALLRAFEQARIPYATAPPPEQAEKLLARALLGLGREVEALPILDGLLAQGSDAEASWLRSRARLRAGDVAGAARDLVKASDFDPAAGGVETEPSPYVGAARCGDCHVGHARTQGESRHARTFRPLDRLHELPYPGAPVADPSDPAITHAYQCTDTGVEFTTRVGAEELRALVLYAFGSGKRATTLVGRDDQGDIRELRISYFGPEMGWGRTSGHALRPPERRTFLGRALRASDMHGCLDCHVTEPRAARDGVGPTAGDHGIRCERCHGPGDNHVRAVQSRFEDLAIALPAGARAAEINRLCGDCHKPRSGGLAVFSTGGSAARFQASTFPLSRCYDPASAKLTCVTCHDPHRDARTSPAFYDQKCLACHGAPASESPTAALDHRPRPCPVDARQGCIDCHMPSVRGTTANTEAIRDHRIQIPARGADGPAG
jgi:tetratricopeptide (TPR) repeat protein